MSSTGRVNSRQLYSKLVRNLTSDLHLSAIDKWKKSNFDLSKLDLINANKLNYRAILTSKQLFINLKYINNCLKLYRHFKLINP